MTKEELFTYIKDELKNCNGYAFIDKAIAELDVLIKQRKSFSCEKFAEWFDSRGVIFKNSPLSFLTKCGFDDIKKGAFDTSTLMSSGGYVICSLYLFNAMRENGIEVINEDTAYIDHIENYILSHGLMNIEELTNWNHQAVAYLANKEKTSKDFIFLFKNTKAMRAIKLPFETLEKEIEEINKEWERLIAELEEVEPEFTAMNEEEILKIIESETKQNEEDRTNDNPSLDTL